MFENVTSKTVMPEIVMSRAEMSETVVSVTVMLRLIDI